MMKHAAAGASALQRLGLVAALVTTLAVVAAKTLEYAPYYTLPGSKTLAIEAMLLLVAYAVVLALPRLPLPRVAMIAGLAGAGIEAAHLVQERFLDSPGRIGAAVTLSFMATTFACWGWAGRRARAAGMPFVGSCWAAVASAMVTMTVTVCAGTFFEWFLAPPSLEAMRGWAEFQRSGWNDLTAFSIANVIESISTHLLMAPVIALFFGAIGAVLGGRDRVRRAASSTAQGA